MMDGKPLLRLDTLVDRPKVAIDGTLYEILAPAELSVLVSHRLGSEGKRIEALMQDDALDEAGRAELARMIRSVSDTIMAPIPQDVRAQLSDAQRMRVLETFMMLSMFDRLGTAAAIVTDGSAMGRTSTGESSFRASSASTAGRRAGGWLKRLMRW